MEDIKLSILIPSINERFEMANALYNKLHAMRCGRTDIEILMFTDDKKRSIGKKREGLVRLANGKYLAFVDDDDDVHEEYFHEIMPRIENGDPDLIIINTLASINGNSFEVHVDIDNENEQVKADEDGNYLNVKRKPFHVCVWRSKIAKSAPFPDKNYGEDWDWCEKLLPKVKTHVKINKLLHIYKYDDEVTQAFD